jgi:DNA-binding PadR family transcriptional regulator
MTDADDFLPLQEPTFYILLSLRGGEKHGYAILKDVAEMSSEQVKLSTGTLYGALYRLLDQGLIEQIEPEDKARGKKVYRLLHSGLEVFEAEVGRMKHLLLAVNKKVETIGGQQV